MLEKENDLSEMENNHNVGGSLHMNHGHFSAIFMTD
jgi:hypothetical protein